MTDIAMGEVYLWENLTIILKIELKNVMSTKKRHFFLSLCHEYEEKSKCKVMRYMQNKGGQWGKHLQQWQLCEKGQ